MSALSSCSPAAVCMSGRQTLLQTLKRLILMAVVSCENDGQMLPHQIHRQTKKTQCPQTPLVPSDGRQKTQVKRVEAVADAKRG